MNKLFKKAGFIKTEERTMSVKNISGCDQWHGLYHLPADKWATVPESLVKRLIGDPNYQIEGQNGTVTGYPRILLVTSNDVFYSGGRYYNYQLAVNLARNGCKVSIFTNRQPVFLNDFADYGCTHRIEWLFDEPKTNEYDLVIATPFHDTYIAQKIAEKFELPCACVHYETPDWLHKYEPENLQFRQPTSQMQFEAIKKCDYHIALSETAKKYVHEWTGAPYEKIFVVNPAFNNLAADKAVPIKKGKRPLVVFVGRLVGRKCWQEFLVNCLVMEREFDIAVVGANPVINSIGTDGNEKHKVTWYNKVSDVEKFAVFKAADLFVIPSRFEGYGIVPGEALHLGKPCIVFDLPVLHEVYGDNLIYAKHMDWGDLKQKIVEQLRVKKPAKKTIDTYKYTMDAQKDTLRELPFIPYNFRQRDDIRFSFCMIAFNVADWIKPCLDAVYDEAHEIIIVEGAVDWWQKYAKPDGRSTDSTTEAILSYPDPLKKIKYSYGKFATKLEMRQATVEQITGTHYWLLDPDEIWVGVDKMRQVIFDNPEIEVFHTKPLHFWHDAWHYATGGIWETRHLRVCEWKEGHCYKHHTNPHDKDGFMIHGKEQEYAHKSMNVDDCIRYHYGMALLNPEDVKRKVEYYSWRDKDSNPLDVREKQEWLGWREGKPMSDGVVIKRFYGEHPPQVQELLKKKGVKEPKWRREHNK